MCSITKGRTDPCNDSIGGIENIYLWNFVEYRRYEITIADNTLVTYPTTTIYKYELRADGNTFTDDFQTEENGISYNQTVTAILKQIQLDYYNDTNLINKRVGCIIETRKGEFFIIGLYNGCRLSNVSVQSGGSRSDFNGLNITINAREKNNAFFIDDLAGAGFIVDGDVQTDNYIFQDNNNFIFQDSNNFIFN